ncbi:Oidioi.mRNA.OKI2018_I69.XSR.g13940.t1.cds [Oikopleura dioica]|uniref:Oidioi.mRNA.OKI2018_I69.XSR.g13940.t1.cds n=1 Tax=Oikopleura dioica TaxID=34765 RepID=A0ABN7S8C8_OIKDI|nr:Oidioi.mRNA.OKI2018_I69.XSR.g13940.t1.cds [Oikopleura dioica]
MSVLGKISADPAILEPQRQQVDALLSEFNSRKERYNQLQADCLSLNDSSKSQDMKQLSSRWNELEQKLEERKIAIDEALKCTREIEQETAKLQDFLTTVTADLAISSRLPPVPDSVEDCLKKLKQHQTQVTEMEKSAKLAQQAAEFLAQVASGAENHGNKSHSVGQALFISTKKLDEKIGTLTELLANIDEAYKLRSELFNSINAIEKGPTYGREEINALRSKYDELVSLVEDISENTSPIRNNSLREDKRSIQRKIKALETGLDQRERDESRRARKQAQLLSFINEREQQIASTHEGEAQPDAIHQKITLVQTLKDELTARMGELKAQFGGPTDSQVQQSFNNLLEKSTDRAKELQDAKLQAEELDGLLHDFNEWAEDSLEKILAATNLKSPETLYEMQTMMEECKDQRGEIELICSLLKGVEPAGKRWGGRPLEQVHSDALHTLDRIKSLLSERTEAADDALNRVKRFEESIEKLTAWYREIGDDLDKIKSALDLTEPEVIDKMVDDVGRISTILQSKMATREIMSRECQMMNFDLAEGMKDSVEEKLSKLESTASETELKCRELQNLLEKVQRASTKYAEVRDELLPWVEDMEVRLDQFDDVSLPDESLIEDLSQMSEEIAERRLLADRLVLTADKLAPLGAIQVKNEAAQISSRYSDIRERCRQRKRETQQLAIEHQQYSERLNNLNNALQRIDERLSNSDRPECNVEKCRAAMADLNQLSKELDKLEAAKTTLQKTGQSQLSDPKINSELAKIDSTWDHLQNTLKNKRDRLRQTEAASERFWAKNSQFQNQLDQLEGELREIKPTHDGKRDMDQFEKKITAMAGLNKKVSDTARDLGSLGENSEALRMAREGQSQLDRIARNMQQKQNEIEAAAKEHENMQRKAREALSWMQSADVRLKAQGEPNSPDDCREKLRVISDIKNQAPKFAAALPAASWRQFENRLAEEVRDTENKLISMGHFDQALDEISDWTSRCSTTLSSIGQDASALQTDFARAELIMSELESRQRALEKLRETAVERFPLKQKRLIAISDNLSKIGSIASTKHDVIRSRIEAAESTELKKKKVQRWAADIREYLINDGPYSGSSEGAKAQSDECRNKISEMVKQRGECPAALPDVRWQQMETALSERKNKLGNLQLEVDTFWDAAKKMDKSLGQFESQIQKMQPPSVVEDSTNLQIEQNRKLEDDIRLKTNQVKTIEDLSGSLRANINREDAIQVKNAALSIHSRWEKCLQATNRRNLALEENRKRATKYSEMVIELVDFIELSRSKLEEAKSSCDPRNGKRLLTKHSEIEREIARNEKGYDNVKKEAAHLLKIAKLPSDVTAIEVELKDIQNKWGNLQNLSWNFVKDLQDSMVSSGRLIDALESLEEWLIKVEPELSERRPLEGDLDTVERLLENHRDFKRELEERERSFSDIRRLVVDLSEQDAAWMRPQISGLGSRWENLRTLSRRRDDKLARAKVRAQEFQDEVNNTLNWLAIAEERLDNIAMLLDGDTSGSLLDKAKRNQSDLVADMDKNKAQLDRAVQLGNGILTNADPDAVGTLKHWLGALTAGWQEVQAWIEQLGERIKRIENDDADAQQRLDALLNWLTGAQDQLSIRNRSPLPADITRLKQLAAEHQQFQEEILARQTEFDELIRIYKKNSSSNVMRESYGSLKRNTKITNQGLVEFKNSKAALLSGTWQSVWLAALERQRAIANALDGAEESQFDFDTWRKRYMAWMNHKKSRVMETMRSFDKNNTGFIENKRFINGVIDSGFDTNEREMRKVVKMFDRDGNGQIDYYEFISALHPRDQYKPETDAAKIEDEVIREVSRCRCCERFAIHQISDNKYRFGDSQQLRLVRILKSTVMVRVGGGWMALEEFLSKNDPCRVRRQARGKVAPRSDGFPTDPLADGVSQTMSAFTRKSRRDRHNSTSSQQPIRTTPTDRPNTRPGSRIPSRNPSRSNSRAGSRAGSRDPSPHNRIPNLSVLSPKSLTPQGLISPMSHRSSGRKTPSGYKTPSGRKTPSSNSKTGDSDIAEAARRLYTLQTERNSKL